MIPQEWLQYIPGPIDPGVNSIRNVFVCHGPVNRIWLLNLCDVLNELGYNVSINQCALSAEHESGDEIKQVLEGKEIGILIWITSIDSAWIPKEYSVFESKKAADINFKFLPIKLDVSEIKNSAAESLGFVFSTYPDGPNGAELIKLVYAIADKSLNEEATQFVNEQNQLSTKVSHQINAAIKNKEPETLVELSGEGNLAGEATAAMGCKAAEGLIKLNKNTEAIRILGNIEQQFPKSIRPRQLHALAMARRGENGDLNKAQDVLRTLYAAGARDPETLGIYARTWMDLYAKTQNVSYLEQSRNLYADAFEKAPDDYYTGINAAAKSVLLGTTEDLEKAKEYAERVQKLTGEHECYGDYWKTATIAELFLIQKKYKEAGEMYGKAVEMAKTETASHGSSWKQARLLMQKLQPGNEERLLVLAPFQHLPGYLQV